MANHKKWVFRSLFILALMIVGLTANHIYRLPKFHDGEQATPFNVIMPDGKPFSLDELRGQYVLLDFWGSWCPPCRKENPKLVSLYKKYNGRKFNNADNFEIVSIAIETKKEKWQNAVKTDSLYWPYHISEFKRFSSPTVSLYGVKEIPTKYLLSPDGIILMVNPDFDDLDAFLEKESINLK